MLNEQGLPTGGKKSISIATSPNNKLKNRFANICVCKSLYQYIIVTDILAVKLVSATCIDDDDRVVLKPLDKYESDYVNASYVDVSTQPLVSACTYTFPLYLGIHYTKEVHCHSRYVLHVCVSKSFGLPLIRSTAKDCGGFVEASVAGESPHHRDDHQPAGGD